MKKLRKIKETDNKIVSIRRKKKRRKPKVFFIILLFVAAVFCLMLTPAFNIKTITVTGNKKSSDETVLAKSGIYVNKNIFQVNVKHSKEKINEIPYVESCHIYRKLPSSVEISVKERTAVAYIKCGTGCILLDIKGRLLEAVGKGKVKVPEVTGINTKNLKVGSQIADENSEQIKSFAELMDKLKELQLTDRVSSINIKNFNNLTFVFDNNKTVVVGPNFRLEYKLMMLKAAIDDISPSQAGTIDLSDEGKALFSPKE